MEMYCLTYKLIKILMVANFMVTISEKLGLEFSSQFDAWDYFGCAAPFGCYW